MDVEGGSDDAALAGGSDDPAMGAGPMTQLRSSEIQAAGYTVIQNISDCPTNGEHSINEQRQLSENIDQFEMKSIAIGQPNIQYGVWSHPNATDPVGGTDYLAKGMLMQVGLSETQKKDGNHFSADPGWLANDYYERKLRALPRAEVWQFNFAYVCYSALHRLAPVTRHKQIAKLLQTVPMKDSHIILHQELQRHTIMINWRAHR